MQIRPYLGLVFVAVLTALACHDGATPTSLPARLRPSFSLGGIAATTCGKYAAWSADENHHFDSLNIIFYDENGAVRGQCGDLSFADQPGAVRAQWNPRHINQYSTWLLKARSTDPTRADSMVQLSHSLVQEGTLKDTTFSITLPSDADVLSLRIFISTPVATTPAAFDGVCDEACVQHWRHINTPDFDSAKVVSTYSITLYWRNHSFARTIDSTEIYRNGVRVAATSGGTAAYIDGPLTVGTYAYQIRGIAPPSPNQPNLLATPNSDYSVERVVTVGPPPPTALACAGNFAATIDCQWTITTQTDSTLVYRDAVVKARLAPGVATWTDASVSRGSSYSYQVAHLRGTLVGALTAAVPTVANPVAPSALACAKTSISTSRCTWTNGETADSTAVQRQEAGTWTGIAILVPGTSLYNDASLHGGVTYTYRVEHRRGTDASAFSASVAVTIDSPPPPTNFVCRGNFNPWMDCSWTNTDATDSVYIYRNNAFRARIAPGITGWTDDPVTADVTYTYNIRHVDRTIQGPLSPTISETATAEAPGNLSCGGTSVSTVTCVWIPTEPGDTAIVEDSTAGRFGNWTYRGKVPPHDPALGQFFDTGLTQGVTYWYRVYYRKGSRMGRYSNIDPAVPDSIAEPYGPIGH